MIEFAWEQVAWVSGILVVAATIQGVAGFGFMLVAVAGLIQIYPAQLVVPGLSLVYVPLGLAQSVQVRREVDWSMLGAWGGGAVFGLLPGTLLLAAADTETMKRGIGLLMVLVALLLRIRPGTPFVRDGAARIGAGALSGLLGASTTVAGPPIVLFGIKQRWPVGPFRATLLTYFALLYAGIAAFQAYYGLVTMETVRWSLSGLPGIALGFLTATYVRDWVDDENFRKLGIGLVLAGGLLALLP